MTGGLADALAKELNCDIAFTIPLFGGIPIAESVVVTWILMVVLVLVSIVLTRNLSVEHPGKRQLIIEAAYSSMYHFFEDLVGEKGRPFIFYLMSVALYLCVSNLLGLIGVKPPTKDMGVTAALALMTIVLVQGAGIWSRGPKGFLKSFAQPMPLITPMNLMELGIRPLSLCMRLFGNVLGSFVVMELLKMVAPYIVPAIFSCYFDIFDGLIQAYVFVFLTALYLSEHTAE